MPYITKSLLVSIGEFKFVYCNLNRQIDEKSAVRRMRNSGRRSREDKRSNSKGNATDGDDDDDDDEEEEAEDQVGVEGTSSSAISVVEAIVNVTTVPESTASKPQG